VTRTRVGEPALPQARDDLGAEDARGLEQQSGKIRLAHAGIVTRGPANVNLLDRNRRYAATMTVEVRPARPEEYQETGRVTALAYREFADSDSWDRYLELIADVGARADIALVLAAFEDGRVLGSATLELDRRIEDDDPALPPEQAEIRMLGVDPDRRGRGVARALMDACFAWAARAGKTRMLLHTTQRMKVAREMYEAMGFERLPDRTFPDGFVLLTYGKAIEPETREP
jgi:GNAT superfamily N-acetyltransferase